MVEECSVNKEHEQSEGSRSNVRETLLTVVSNKITRRFRSSSLSSVWGRRLLTDCTAAFRDLLY
jgi:hypothetical protein